MVSLEQGTRPDPVYAGHQCAHFLSAPKWGHAKAVKDIDYEYITAGEYTEPYQLQQNPAE